MARFFHTVDQCVTAPLGFRAGVIASGIKADASLPDLAILASDVPCIAAGTFTTSSTRAAPVLLCQDRLRTGQAQAVIVNSGNANCATGSQGQLNAYRMTEIAAAHLHLPDELVLCSSTGIIGRQLPMEKIEAGVEQIRMSRDGGNAFAEAILTTDTRPKRIALEFELEGRTVRLGGATKGAGMIYPNMATMLCYLTTDAALDLHWLRSEMQATVAETFNMLSVDGDMSTNDSCLLLANGLAGNTPISARHPDAERFRAALREVMEYLAKEIARDGEGATKLMTVNVRGAATQDDAIKAARAVTLSPLWQCALAGGDPNWGRIVAALGNSGCQLHQESYDILLGDVLVVQQGTATAYDQARAFAVMAEQAVTITIDLHLGEGQATAWGCDLTHGYIDENTVYVR